MRTIMLAACAALVLPSLATAFTTSPPVRPSLTVLAADQPGAARTGEIAASGAFARATTGRVGGVFLTLSNTGLQADRLLSGTSPAAAAVELHETVMRDGVARMQAIPQIEVRPGAPVELKPGGLHVMLMGLKAPLKQGDTVALELRFERAGVMRLQVPIMAPGAGAGGHGHGHRH